MTLNEAQRPHEIAQENRQAVQAQLDAKAQHLIEKAQPVLGKLQGILNEMIELSSPAPGGESFHKLIQSLDASLQQLKINEPITTQVSLSQVRTNRICLKKPHTGPSSPYFEHHATSKSCPRKAT